MEGDWVVFRPKTRPRIHVITVSFFIFFYVFLKIKKRDFLRFLVCFTHFLELHTGTDY